jgi:hypothetical protein
VSLTERLTDPPEHWPSADVLRKATTEGSFVLLPDDVRDVDGTLTAFFRTDAQALRVRASNAGLKPVLLAPDGAEVAGYSEYAADWVLPVVVTAALSIPSAVVADVIHDGIANKPESGGAAPTVRYREAVVDGDRVRVREIEGPADEVERLLRERGAQMKLPPLSPVPPPLPSADDKP